MAQRQIPANVHSAWRYTRIYPYRADRRRLLQRNKGEGRYEITTSARRVRTARRDKWSLPTPQAPKKGMQKKCLKVCIYAIFVVILRRKIVDTYDYGE